jgi:cytochrome c553
MLGSAFSLVSACGASVPQSATLPEAPSAESAVASASEAVVPATWTADMSQAQQVAFMKQHVMPALTPAFQQHDAARYADFSCKTCHGPEYKNPHEFLPRLTMANGQLTSFAEKPEVSKFMAEVVTPKMAQAMGLPPFDMTTHEGFGCGGCHAIDMK